MKYARGCELLSCCVLSSGRSVGVSDEVVTWSARIERYNPYDWAEIPSEMECLSPNTYKVTLSSAS